MLFWFPCIPFCHALTAVEHTIPSLYITHTLPLIPKGSHTRCRCISTWHQQFQFPSRQEHSKTRVLGIPTNLQFPFGFRIT
ncbi:hypothetical protein IQ07DRAFT_211178 [Pyrenochaeta sp. DS3sAY3a]|nr:hypothetical protein IQ07DRAFT_211178 [Pyrenochaeta sp. DS3sAY3a]